MLLTALGRFTPRTAFLASLFALGGLSLLFFAANAQAQQCTPGSGYAVASGGQLPPGKKILLSGARRTIRAAGNNAICVSSRKATIILAPNSAGRWYRIVSSKGNKQLTIIAGAASPTIGRLAVKTTASSRLRLDSDIQRLTVISGRRADYISGRGLWSKSKINTGWGADRIDWRWRKRGEHQPRLAVSAGGGNNSFRLPANSNLNLRTGAGNDQIAISGPGGRTARRQLATGLGSDRVIINGSGSTRAQLSPQRLQIAADLSAADNDYYLGGSGVDLVTDYHGTWNKIHGRGAADRFSSLGRASSALYGQTGNDYLFAAAQGQRRDLLSGGRNNDYIYADRGRPGIAAIGAVIEGGEGDESIIQGSAGDDIILYRSGVKRILAGAGEDYILRTTTGRGIIDGQQGNDTISYLLHAFYTPDPEDPCLDGSPGREALTGVKVEKQQIDEQLSGQSWRYAAADNRCQRRDLDQLQSLERVIGSPENDIINSPGEVVPGPSIEEVVAKQRTTKSQQEPLPTPAVVFATVDRWPVILGSKQNEDLRLSWQSGAGYQLHSSLPIIVQDDQLCQQLDLYTLNCPKLPPSLLFSLDDGDDSLQVDKSVPKSIFITAHLGSGNNWAHGGSGDDFISSSFGTSNIWSGAGDDRIIFIGQGSAFTGPGDDLINLRQSPCQGRTVAGGAGGDNLLFVGAGEVLVDYGLRGRPAGVNELPDGAGVAAPLDLSSGAALSFDLQGQSCPPGQDPLLISADIEALEGSSGTDYFIGSASRQLKILGRQGPDIYWTAGNQLIDHLTIHGQDDGSHDLLQVDDRDLVAPCFGDSGHIPLEPETLPPGCQSLFQP